MMKKIFILCVMLLSMLLAAVAWAELKEGFWEITTQTELKGMPGVPGSMPSTTFRQCIANNNAVPKNTDKNYTCKTVSQKTIGNTTNYNIECKSKEGVMLTSGAVTYTANTMSGSSTTSFKMQGQPEMKMLSKIRGKYIGVCPK